MKTELSELSKQTNGNDQTGLCCSTENASTERSPHESLQRVSPQRFCKCGPPVLMCQTSSRRVPDHYANEDGDKESVEFRDEK
ncbi:hypothetical protein F2P81_020355 [Scophthalmus maximus]|uniref:Uncharacterized protein n=1 Tax=Scophthalmus maximus TaxID=52904 RepID=A0A6A4SA64_SCOMX|nr:hypothetical protein F2P81_020355 [Scophthalmus maximus]